MIIKEMLPLPFHYAVGEPTCTTALYKTATDDLKHRQWLDYNKPLSN